MLYTCLFVLFTLFVTGDSGFVVDRIVAVPTLTLTIGNCNVAAYQLQLDSLDMNASPLGSVGVVEWLSSSSNGNNGCCTAR